jgi:hypothetical protein
MKVIIPVCFFIIFVFIIFIFSNFLPYDSTDDIENKHKSGMEVLTDYQTGCQYLSTGTFGGITPRLDKDGHQIGCR